MSPFKANEITKEIYAVNGKDYDKTPNNLSPQQRGDKLT